MSDRKPFEKTIFKNPMSVMVQNISTGAMVEVIDNEGWSHTFYARADTVSLTERKDISRQVVKTG